MTTNYDYCCLAVCARDYNCQQFRDGSCCSGCCNAVCAAHGRRSFRLHISCSPIDSIILVRLIVMMAAHTDREWNDWMRTHFASIAKHTIFYGRWRLRCLDGAAPCCRSVLPNWIMHLELDDGDLFHLPSATELGYKLTRTNCRREREGANVVHTIVVTGYGA